MHLRSLPLALHKQANRIRFFLGCLLLRIAEWIELHGRIPVRGAIFFLIVALVTILLFSVFPTHPLRLAAALGLGLAAGVIVRSLEMIKERI